MKAHNRIFATSIHHSIFHKTNANSNKQLSSQLAIGAHDSQFGRMIVRPQSLSSSTVENRKLDVGLYHLSGATDTKSDMQGNNATKMTSFPMASEKPEPQTTLPINQRRGSSPSKLHLEECRQLSPPIVRINSPQNNEDLDAVEKHLGDMLEATIASIESGFQFKSTTKQHKFTSAMHSSHNSVKDDQDSPMSFFTGSLNYFLKPCKRYDDNEYAQPAQYSSWSTDVSSADWTNEASTSASKKRRAIMREFGKTQSLEPSWTTTSEDTHASEQSSPKHTLEFSPTYSDQHRLCSETSEFDSEDQIDEYMMMLHSNPELFLASVRKGYVPTSNFKNYVPPCNSTPGMKHRLSKPKMKEIGRAQTLEPSWTPETSPKKQRSRYCADIITSSSDRFEKKDFDSGYVRKTQSFPETDTTVYGNISNRNDHDDEPSTYNPSIIITPPSRSSSFVNRLQYAPQFSIMKSGSGSRQIRSHSLAPEKIHAEAAEAVHIKRFLSHGNLISQQHGEGLNSSIEYLPLLSTYEDNLSQTVHDRYYIRPSKI